MKSILSWLSRQFRRPAHAPKSRRPQVEALEDRSLPAVLFSPQTVPTVMDGGGLVLKDTPVYLIYWGSAWGSPTASPTMNQINGAVEGMLNSDYLTQLAQYRTGLGIARFGGSAWYTSDPRTGFSGETLVDVVQYAYNHLGLPDPDDIEPNIPAQLGRSPLYVVVTPPGVLSDDPSAAGYHTWYDEAHDEWFDWDDVYFAWVGNQGTLDSITTVLSHEVVEALSNPEVIGGITATTGGDGELSDGEAQNFNYRVNGSLLQSYWSRNHGAYIVPSGTFQNVTVTNGSLIVTGDQLTSFAGPNDTITVGASGGGVRVTLNGEVFQFDPGVITSIQVRAGNGEDTVNVEQTLAAVSLSIDTGGGINTVNVGTEAGSMNDIQGRVSVSGIGGTDTLNLRDQGNSVGQIFTLSSSTVTRSSAARITYIGVETIAIRAGTATDHLTLTVAPNVTVSFDGGLGTDTVNGPPFKNAWSITGSNTGTVGRVSFLRVENLVGGSNTDTFSIGVNGSLSGGIRGGGDIDTLDYGTWTRAVTVSLQDARASAVTGSVSDIENVTGGSGNDLLRGNGSANTLDGGGGNDILIGLGSVDTLYGRGDRDLLIGGLGGDTLYGGIGDDILIDGTTSHDNNDTKLRAIITAWGRTDRTYTQRQTDLAADLNTGTVTSDSSIDSLWGEGDLDWFWALSNDQRYSTNYRLRW